MGALGFLLCHALAAAAPAGSVAVLGLQAKQGVSKDAAELLTDRLSTELKKAGRFERLVGTEEISAAMSLQQQQQLLDCTSASCMVELAGALAVEWVLIGSVGRMGGQWLLNVKLVDARSADAVVRVSRTVPGDNEGVLLGLVEGSVAELLTQLDAALAARSKTPPAQVAPPPPDPTPAPTPAAQEPVDDSDVDTVFPEDDRNTAVKPAGWPTTAGAAAAGAGVVGMAAGLMLMTAGVLVAAFVPTSMGVDAYYTVLVTLAPTSCLLGCLSCGTGVGAMLAGAGLYASRLYFRREGGSLWRRPWIPMGAGSALLACGGLGLCGLTLVGAGAFASSDDKASLGPYKVLDAALPLLVLGGAASMLGLPAFGMAVAALSVVVATDLVSLLFLGPSGP